MAKLPFNEEVEKLVLVCMLQSQANRRLILSDLDWSDFWISGYQDLFRAIKAVSEDFTIDKLFHEVKKQKVDTKPLEAIYSLSELSTDYEAAYYAKELKFLSNRRRIILKCNDVIEVALNAPEGFEQSSADLRKALVDCMQLDSKRPETFGNIYDKFKGNKSFIEKLKDDKEKRAAGFKVIDGLETGFPKLDDRLAGFQNGHNIIVGARPGNGKTTLVCSFILNILERYPELPILFFSLEMNRNRITEKLLCMKAQIPIKRLKDSPTEEEIQRLALASEEIKKGKLCVYDQAGASIDTLEAIANYNKEMHGLGIIFVDYLTIVGRPFGTRATARHEQVGEVSKGLYRMSRSLNVPIVTLAQLSRNVTSRADKRPLMSDLKESGQIEEDADSILLMHRPSVYEEASEYMDDTTYLYCEKNRELGDRFRVDLDYRIGRFYELPPIQGVIAGW